MSQNSSTIASIIGGLLVVFLGLPILVGGTRGTLFWMLFWGLALGLAATLIFAIATRSHQH
jgi:hypothetical protein